MNTQPLLVIAAVLQMVAVAYCVALLRRHWVAARAWLCLLGVLMSMLVWRLVVVAGVVPGQLFNTSIAIGGSIFAVAAMFFFGREVGRRERAEAERDHLLESERVARADAERASRTKDAFFATLSHELRTPLAAILGWCEILRHKAGGSPDVDRAVATIDRNARMQARLVDDLLDATRMQSGAIHLERVLVSLDAPVAAAIDTVRPLAQSRSIEIELTCDAPPPVVLGDASRLQQIAANLLVNAIKFSSDGRKVSVVIRAQDDEAELVVHDTGCGIDPAFLPHLFQPFRQAESGATRKHGGLGLGLSIVSSLATLHGGRVEAVSDGVGRGATFTVTLPRERTQVAPAPVVDDSPGAPATLEGLRVLLVDDEADVRDAVSRVLEQAGAVVQTLPSGETIQAAMTEFAPDVLLLDIGMPGEDGYSLIRRVRAFDGTKIPAVSLTAHAREEDRAHALASGFQAHLPKPVQFPVLIRTIAELGAPKRD